MRGYKTEGANEEGYSDEQIEQLSFLIVPPVAMVHIVTNKTDTRRTQ